MDANDRTLFVQILAQMLIADGVLADEERAHLDRVMDGLEMPDDARAQALKGVSIDSPVEERVAALSSESRAQLLAEVEKAMQASVETSNSAQHFIERVRALVG